jgi:hypothetical protein
MVQILHMSVDALVHSVFMPSSACRESLLCGGGEVGHVLWWIS